MEKKAEEILKKIQEKESLFDFIEEAKQEPKKLERLIQRRLINDPLELAKAMRAMGVGKQASLWERLHTLTLPVLLIAGQKDSKYVSLMQAMAELLPQGQVKVVPNAGHNVHLEQPMLLAHHIKEFILKE